MKNMSFCNITRLLPWLEDMTAFKCDTYNTLDTVELLAELPGYDPQMINIIVGDGELTITAEKWPNVSNDLLPEEERHKKVSRNFPLSASVNTDNVQAHYNNGVLSVTLEKLHKLRRITISPGPPPAPAKY